MKTLNQPKKNGAMKRRAVAALCAVVMLAVCVPMIGGTLAYLIDKTPELVNRFELGELTYKLIFVENKPEKTAEGTAISEMPTTEAYTRTVPASEHTFSVTEEPKLTGYKFVGWADTAAATETDLQYPYANGKSDVKVEYDPAHYDVDTATTTKTVYAVWKQMDFIVTFDTQVEGLTVDPRTMKVTYQEPYNKHGDLPVPVRTGYEFTGWALDKMGSRLVNDTTIVNTSGNHTLYAIWGAKSYIIRYHANGGTGTMGEQTVRYDSMISLTPNAFAKEDHTFLGWSTSPDGAVEYINEQEVVNLREGGYIDLYAVWAQDTHTVTFDYNLGTGVPPTKQVLYGQEYGVLPTYPTRTESLFTGWYTKREGGTRVIPTTIVDRMDDHTLYAHWESSPANDIIKNLTVKNNPDDNYDGVVDDVYLTFECSSSFEKFNIPIKGLVPGQTYKLTYTASNNASFGDYYNGYSSARYGSYILPTATNSAGNINDAVAQDILATWNNRSEPDGDNDGSQKATNDAYLNGPWKNRTITFTATAETMYWAWEFGLMEDGPLYEYNITDINIEPVVPEIKFGQKDLILASGSVAQVLNDTSSAYATNFVFDGDSYAETMYYPITGLTAGTTYTIILDHRFSGKLIHDTKDNPDPTYEYGFGIMNKVPTKYNSTMNTIGGTGDWISNTFVMRTVTGNTESVTLTFTATSDTAYWVWNMANCSDGTNCPIDVKVTKFSAKHSSGKSITYYTAPSNATAIALMMAPKDVEPIALTYDISIDELYPFSDMQPFAGMDYIMTFTPAEGYAMPEYVRVTIDGEEYLYISAQLPKGVDYDGNECYVLTISSELLANASTLHIEAIAETAGVTYVDDLADVSIDGADNTDAAGEDGVLVLRGENLPNIITVTTKDDIALDGAVREKGTTYMTSLDKTLLHASIMAWEAEPRDWLTVNEDASITLTIPAGHMKDGEVLTISGMYYETTPLTEFTLDDLF